MSRRDELEALSSKDLHDRAVSHAVHRVDLRFFYHLLATLPAAETAAGEVHRGGADVFTIRDFVADAVASDEGGLADALRPFYIEYLLDHGG